MKTDFLEKASPSQRFVDCSLVVVTWNRPDLLRQCLTSIRRAVDASGLTCETWVVDNASTAGDSGVVEGEFPEVRLLRAECNLGFARANNRALHKVSGRYCLLVNNDVMLAEDTLTRMIEYMDSSPRVGIAGAMLVDAAGNLQTSFADVLTPVAGLSEALLLGALLRRLSRSRRKPVVDHPFSVGYVSGAFLMIRRETIDQIGLLDERFDFYSEEMDWCARAHHAGWQVVTVPNVRVVHHHGATAQSQRDRFVALRLESRRRFLEKHYGGVVARCYRASVVVGGMLLLLRSLFPGGGRTQSARAADAVAQLGWALRRKELWPP